MMEDKLYWVWLSQVFFYGSEAVNKVLEHFDDPKDFYACRESHFEGIDYLSKNELDAAQKTSLKRAEKIIADCERLSIKILTQADEGFPSRLKSIYGTPPVLYLRGDLSGIDDEPAVAVVGTRHASDFGKSVTGNLCYELARAGMTIISGCAVGIDAYALRGALKAGGRPIGVLGCGLDINYPAENEELKREIAQHGALISELPPGFRPSGMIFPIRNRLMAGLASGVVVTEAPVKSGALITVEHAVQQGKDVFCLPPLIYGDARFGGVISPLRDGATAVYGAADILFAYYMAYPHKLNAEVILENDQKKNTGRKKSSKEHQAEKGDGYESDGRHNKAQPAEKAKEQLPFEQKPDIENVENQSTDGTQAKDQNEKKPLPEGASAEMETLYACMDFTPIQLDKLVSTSGLPVSRVLALLTQMEIEGIAQSYSGRRYGLLPR